MGVRGMDLLLEPWEMNARDSHRRMILGPTPRAREYLHAVWRLTQNWTATADASGQDPHTIGGLSLAPK